MSAFMNFPPRDSFDSLEYNGFQEVAPPTQNAEPLFGGLLSNRSTSTAFDAAQRAAKYAAMANYFDQISTKHWQIGQSCKENAVLAYRQQERELLEKTFAGSDLLKNIRNVCGKLKEWLLVTKRKGQQVARGGSAGDLLTPAEEEEIARNAALLTSPPVLKARVLCGNIERTAYPGEGGGQDQDVPDRPKRPLAQLYATPPNAYPRRPIWPPSASTNVGVLAGGGAALL